jgi:mono/diheme cytochrome c family protein
MRRILFWMAMVGSVPALAADAAQGEVYFQKACANCHTAIQVQKDGKTPTVDPSYVPPHLMGPDLAQFLKGSTVSYFRKWTKNPWAIRDATACDPRLLQSTQLEDLIAFVSSRARPAPQHYRRMPMYRRNH